MKNLPIPRLMVMTLVNIAIAAPLLSILRCAFYLYFRAPDTSLATPLLLEALFVGAKFDLRLLLLLFAPLLLLGWIKPINPFTTRLGRRLWSVYLTLVYTVLGLFYIIDFGHYAYLESRLDATALRFLYNFHDSFHMVIQSYPVVPLLLLVILLIAAAGYGEHRLLGWLAPKGLRPQRRWKSVATIAAIGLVYALGIYGKFSWYPLRWSDAFFSNNAFASAVALNPVLYFYDTLKNREVAYDRDKAQAYYDLMADYLGMTHKDKAHLSFVRREQDTHGFAKPPNVVIVILESFGFYKTSLSGNPLDPTPQFDRLARRGVLFTRYYSPHGGTARSVFTAVTGLPDIELVKTSSRNPLVVRQHVIANEMKDYSKFYFLGGSASWGEIRGLLSTNIKGLNIYEEGSYSSPRVDVWGISDLSLFKEANAVLKKTGPKPFLAIIQTSGNHRPYTIPDDNDGFQPKPIPDETAQRYGFRSSDAYNSYRFMDHSIGRFMEIARQEAYFDNTVFFFFGDHGLARTAEHRPAYEHDLMMNRYHVPLLIYAPGLITTPQVIERVASEVDVMPTIAGLTGRPYINSTFGRDLFDPRFDDSRYAFTILHAPVPLLGLIGSDFYYNVMGDGRSPKLYKLDPQGPVKDRADDYPAVAKKMNDLCMGIYQSARYVRYHNKPEEVDRLAAELP
jgi:phosphoglycerol transferase MdoB-like AlkP superfamily enzyme